MSKETTSDKALAMTLKAFNESTAANKLATMDKGTKAMMDASFANGRVVGMAEMYELFQGQKPKVR
jgi:hypothetical protein